MSLEVRVPKEITEYKEKVMFGFTLRQLVSIGVAVVVGLLVFFIIRPLVGLEIAGNIVIVCVVPVFALGFVKINGRPLEAHLKIVFRYYKRPFKRKYQTELYIDAIEEQKNVLSTSAKRIKKTKEREATGVEVAEKERKRTRKKVLREIKNAKAEYRKEKCVLEKAKKEGESA